MKKQCLNSEQRKLDKRLNKRLMGISIALHWIATFSDEEKTRHHAEIALRLLADYVNDPQLPNIIRPEQCQPKARA